jgi:hypothetical protein
LLRTITSPALSKLSVVLDYEEFAPLLSDGRFFKRLRSINRARPLGLAFSLGVRFLDEGAAVLYLEEAGRLVAASGLLDFLDPPPTIRICG